MHLLAFVHTTGVCPKTTRHWLQPICVQACRRVRVQFRKGELLLSPIGLRRTRFCRAENFSVGQEPDPPRKFAELKSALSFFVINYGLKTRSTKFRVLCHQLQAKARSMGRKFLTFGTHSHCWLQPNDGFSGHRTHSAKIYRWGRLRGVNDDAIHAGEVRV
ncbi:MAG: hypothetical protein YYHSYBAR_003444 [Candidatus Fervidibacter sacchari]